MFHLPALAILFYCLLNNICWSQSEQGMVGTYMHSDHFYFNSKLELKADSTFSWWDYYSRDTVIIHGSWKTDHGFVIFNSEKQPRTDTLWTMFHSANVGDDFITVHFFEANGEKLSSATCQLKEGNDIVAEEESNWQGFVELQYEYADSIIIKCQGQEIRFGIREDEHDWYKFRFENIDNHYRYITEAKYRISEGRLCYLKGKKLKASRKYYYEKSLITN